jgi:hypothetical protein
MYFEKRASSWEVSDIENLAGTEEGVYIEFKKPSELLHAGKFSPDKCATELAETVSAFLNSDGGVILLGVQTDKPKKDKRTEVLKQLETWSSEQTFEHLGISLTASRIQDLIYGNIIPRPTGIEVKDLYVKFGEVTNTVFVITVTPSPLGAHQSVKTQRYYLRQADGDKPMLDFEIRAVNNRRAGPLLYLACKTYDIDSIPFEDKWENSSSDMEEVVKKDNNLHRIKLIFATSNFGRGTANVARFDIGIPVQWQIEKHYFDGTDFGAYWESRSGLQHSIGSQVTVFWIPEKCSGIPHPYRNKRISEQIVSWEQVIYPGNIPQAHPIWPTSDRRIIGVIRLESQNNGNDKPFSWLPWRAFANDMAETRGAVLLKENSGKIYVSNYEMDEVNWWHQGEDLQKFEELKQIFQVP